MSRDSYKGVPKNRAARIAADGKLLPLQMASVIGI